MQPIATHTPQSSVFHVPTVTPSLHFPTQPHLSQNKVPDLSLEFNNMLAQPTPLEPSHTGMHVPYVPPNSGTVGMLTLLVHVTSYM